MAQSGQKLPSEIAKAIRRMKTAGSSYRTIAHVLGISTRTVGRILKGLGNR